MLATTSSNPTGSGLLNFSALQSPNKSYGVLQNQPHAAQPNALTSNASVGPNATSISTGQPTTGSITGGLINPIHSAIIQNTQNANNAIIKHANAAPLASAPIQAQAAYDGMTGLLTPYGKSQNLPEVNAPKTTAPTSSVVPPTPTSTPSFSGIVGGLTGASQSGSPTAPGYISQTAGYGQQSANTGQQAVDIANKFGQKYADVGQAGAKFEAGQLTTGTTPVAEGNAAVTAQTTAAQQNALAQGEQAALQGIGYEQTGFQQGANAANQAAGQAQTGQGLLQSGLNSAGTLSFPSVGQQGQTFYQPLNAGKGGGSNGLALTGVVGTDISNLSNAVNNGTLDYQSALSQLSGYGTAVQNQLLPAIQKLNPSFNFNLSASSAQTQAQGQQLNTQVTTANQALDSLGTSFAALSGLQTGGIPATNSIAQWIGTELGDQALSKYKSNLADARAQLVGVLNASGGTPTGNEATAMQYLPDNMTPAMFQANVGTTDSPGIVRQLMQQKASTFTGSGQQSNPSQNASSNLYSF